MFRRVSVPVHDVRPGMFNTEKVVTFETDTGPFRVTVDSSRVRNGAYEGRLDSEGLLLVSDQLAYTVHRLRVNTSTPN